MTARGALLLVLVLSLPLTASAAPLRPALAGPVFAGLSGGVARPTFSGLTLILATPAVAETPASQPPVASLPRVMASGPNTGSHAWLDARGGTGLFTGSAGSFSTVVTPPDAQTPEPSTALMLALGLLGLAARRHHRP